MKLRDVVAFGTRELKPKIPNQEIRTSIVVPVALRRVVSQTRVVVVNQIVILSNYMRIE
jgi:hypothetical protein